MTMENIPLNWCEAKLGEVANQITKGTTPTTAGYQYLNSGIPFIKIENINQHGIDLESVTQFISDEANTALLRSQLEEGDILFSIAGTIGKTALVTKECLPANTNQAVAIIRGTSGIFDAKYLRQQLRNSADVIAKNSARGGAMNNISLGDLKEITLSIPSFAEQQQIASKLDELLTQVDSIKTRLDAIPKLIKRFRQSLLAAAVSGKLTEDWREGNPCKKYSEISVELTEFRGKELRKLPKNWQWLKFDQVAIVASNLQDPLLTPEAFHVAPNHLESGTGKLLEYTTVSEDNVTSSKHRFYEGQILYSKIRPYLCKAVIVNFSGLCSADMYPINSNINTHYLFRWILSHQFTDWASNAESRSVLPKINQRDLGVIPVPTPPIHEQTEIVRRVEQLFTYADQIEQRVNDAQARVNHLTQAILAKAFRGELTADWRAQNPELISGENSAEVLLANIQNESKKLNKSRKLI